MSVELCSNLFCFVWIYVAHSDRHAIKSLWLISSNFSILWMSLIFPRPFHVHFSFLILVMATLRPSRYSDRLPEKKLVIALSSSGLFFSLDEYVELYAQSYNIDLESEQTWPLERLVNYHWSWIDDLIHSRFFFFKVLFAIRSSIKVKLSFA